MGKTNRNKCRQRCSADRGVDMRYLPDGIWMKHADEETIVQKQVPPMVLMERAALKTVEVLEETEIDLSKPLIVCGAGNNGGDGYAVARLLHLKGSDVTVVLVGREASMSEETKLQRKILENYGIKDCDGIPAKAYSVIIDAVFGIGLSRTVEGHYKAVIEEMNRLSGAKVAIDIPSGVSSFDGSILGTAFRADITVTFACEKYGMACDPGRAWCGTVFVKDIGIQTDLFDEQTEVAYTYEMNDLREIFPARSQYSHKGTYGKALVIAGSPGMCGAAYLSAKAAYCTGAGLVKIYTDESNRMSLQQLLPEALISTYEFFEKEQLLEELAWANAAVLGCGLGKSPTARQIVRTVLKESRIPCVVDADGLNLISEEMGLLGECQAPVILTPHMKEMSRLTGKSVEEIRKDRITAIRELTASYPVICVLKDARTMIHTDGERIYLNTSGNAAMAKGGSGDVLAGIVGGLLAQGQKPYEAACAGVFLHGLAGDKARDKKGEYSVLASDVIDAIGEILKK